MQLISDAWNEVSERTIINCWIKSSLVEKEKINECLNNKS